MFTLKNSYWIFQIETKSWILCCSRKFLTIYRLHVAHTCTYHSFIHTFMHTCIHVHVHKNRQCYLLIALSLMYISFVHTYVHAYIHKNMHAM